MPARLIGLFTAVAIFLGLKSSKPEIADIDGHIMHAVDTCHDAWVEQGIVKEKHATAKISF